MRTAEAPGKAWQPRARRRATASARPPFRAEPASPRQKGQAWTAPVASTKRYRSPAPKQPTVRCPSAGRSTMGRSEASALDACANRSRRSVCSGRRRTSWPAQRPTARGSRIRRKPAPRIPRQARDAVQVFDPGLPRRREREGHDQVRGGRGPRSLDGALEGPLHSPESVVARRIPVIDADRHPHRARVVQPGCRARVEARAARENPYVHRRPQGAAHRFDGVQTQHRFAPGQLQVDRPEPAEGLRDPDHLVHREGLVRPEQIPVGAVPAPERAAARHRQDRQLERRRPGAGGVDALELPLDEAVERRGGPSGDGGVEEDAPPGPHPAAREGEAPPAGHRGHQLANGGGRRRRRAIPEGEASSAQAGPGARRPHRGSRHHRRWRPGAQGAAASGPRAASRYPRKSSTEKRERLPGSSRSL